jgi:hypothetical protein
VKYTDDELLKIVGDERKQSIGFGEGDSGELTGARETAIAFYKGDMLNVSAEHKVVSLPGRSRAVDTTVADAIETVLPDVLEIFVGGDDIATFIPQGEEDEQKAKDETDFVTHVVMVENEGFLNLYTACKDALLTRTGVFYWWWDETEKAETKHTVPPDQADMAPMMQVIASQMGHEVDAEEQDDGSINLNQTTLHGKVCIRAVPPEDFTVAADTVSLRDATYCAMRDRPRVQDLIARGVDPEIARSLKPYSQRNDSVEQARDTAGEHNLTLVGGTDDLRIVETRAHYIRLPGEDGGLTVWRVETDGEEKILIDKAEVGDIPFAALTPYIVAHRFYGESVADKLIEVQKIKTALLRMHLDSGYFALNQRVEVADSGSNEHTIPDILRNEPGVPIRVKTTGTVTPVSAGQLNFDTLASLEYAATMAESRSGIVRNAQGLNPDTLHDTASGALALISAAQKRVRMIARIFAETGVKDLFLGVHCMLRRNYTDKHAPAQAKIGKTWQTAQPNQWPERCSMTVHIGIGSAGKEHDLAVANQRLQTVQEVITLQGGLEGPLVDATKAQSALMDWERAAGSKRGDQYWLDPSDPNAPKPQPKPDPAMAQVQGKLQIEQAKVQAKVQGDAEAAKASLTLDQAKHQAEMQANEQKAIREHELAVMKITGELELRRETTQAELAMKRELLQAELQMKREIAVLNAEVARETGMAKAQASGSVSEVEPGGEPG